MAKKLRRGRRERRGKEREYGPKAKYQMPRNNQAAMIQSAVEPAHSKGKVLDHDVYIGIRRRKKRSGGAKIRVLATA